MIFYIILAILTIFALFAPKLLYFRSDLHKIPGPRAYPLVGAALSHMISAKEVIPLIESLQKKFGSIYIIWFGAIPVVNVTTPEGAEAVLSNKKNITKGRAYTLLHPWLGQGLLTSDGSHWFSHRRLITPTFHFSILETFLEVFQENSRLLVKSLDRFSATGEAVELKPYITCCALDIICETAMGVKINAQKQAGNIVSENDATTSQYIKSIFRIAQLTTDRILNPLIRAAPIFFRTSKGKSYKRHLEIVHNFTNNVIRSRKEVGSQSRVGKRMAFLDLLLEAKDQIGEGLSEQDIREEVDTFMFEGHDTTAASLVWTMYLLATHSQIQEDIYQELEDIFNGEERAVTLTDLAEMKHLERSIKESLRLYPSVPNVVRSITDEIEINGYKIPKGSSLILHIYQLHRNPEIFPEPEVFNPDRFLPENCANRHPYAYVPFSAGSRNCIGQKFALLEEKLILSEILRTYEVRFEGELERNEIRSELILRPPSGMKFHLKKRCRQVEPECDLPAADTNTHTLSCE